MEPQLFSDYLENRYQDQINYYEKASAKNQKYYKNFQWTLIVLSTITTILAALPRSANYDLQFFVVISAALVTILTSALKTFQYQELWVTYRTTIEQLRPELFYYKFNIGDYGEENADKESMFVKRIEAILSKEHESWPIFTKMNKQENKQELDDLQKKLENLTRDRFTTVSEKGEITTDTKSVENDTPVEDPVVDETAEPDQSDNSSATDDNTETVNDISASAMSATLATPAGSLSVDLSKLTNHIPANVLSELGGAVQRFKINTKTRLAHFLSQCDHESGGFKFISENLNYKAESLRSVFGKYFPTLELAKQYERQPEKIANKVYADRMGNGNEPSGDGYRFRGRGYIQLTGKSNYQSLTDFIAEDVVSNPDLVATKYPLTSAGFFFEKNRIWDLCDQGANDNTVKAVTKMINGGYNGLDDRLAKFNKYYKLLA